MILVPIIFGLLLGSMIFTFLGYNVLDTAKSIGQSIPVVSTLLDRSSPADDEDQASLADLEAERADDAEQQDGNAQETDPQIVALRQQLEAKEAEIVQLREQLEQQANTAMQERISREEYQQQIRELARVYGGMSASRAASIFENMTLTEAAQIIRLMPQQQQTAIMGRLDPNFAAQLTVVLKDIHSVDDPEMAALQERLQVLINVLDEEGAEAKLSINQLAKTYSNLPAPRAAAIFELMSGNQAEFLLAQKILAAMSDQDRSNILAAMDTAEARKYTNALSR
jgi:flagellar motility protein MotE (MotC chaperone)